MCFPHHSEMMDGLLDELKGIVLYSAAGESRVQSVPILQCPSFHHSCSWLSLFVILMQRSVDTMTSDNSTAQYATEDWLKYIELLDHMASEH